MNSRLDVCDLEWMVGVGLVVDEGGGGGKVEKWKGNEGRINMVQPVQSQPALADGPLVGIVFE